MYLPLITQTKNLKADSRILPVCNSLWRWFNESPPISGKTYKKSSVVWTTHSYAMYPKLQRFPTPIYAKRFLHAEYQREFLQTAMNRGGRGWRVLCLYYDPVECGSDAQEPPLRVPVVSNIGTWMGGRSRGCPMACCPTIRRPLRRCPVVYLFGLRGSHTGSAKPDSLKSTT